MGTTAFEAAAAAEPSELLWRKKEHYFYTHMHKVDLLQKMAPAPSKLIKSVEAERE